MVSDIMLRYLRINDIDNLFNLHSQFFLSHGQFPSVRKKPASRLSTCIDRINVKNKQMKERCFKFVEFRRGIKIFTLHLIVFEMIDH